LSESAFFSGLSYAGLFALVAIALTVFCAGVLHKLRMWGRGSSAYMRDPESTGVNNFVKNFMKQMKGNAPSKRLILKTIVLDVLFQRRELRQRKLRGLMHLCIFWGFILLFAMSMLVGMLEAGQMLGEFLERIGAGVIGVPIVSALFWFAALFGGGPSEHAFLMVRDSMFAQTFNDFLGYVLLIGVVVAIFNRLLNRQTRQASSLYDWAPLIWLLVIVVTGFLAEWARPQYFGWGFNQPMALFHVIISLSFIALIPFTKYIHLITTPLALLVNAKQER